MSPTSRTFLDCNLKYRPHLYRDILVDNAPIRIRDVTEDNVCRIMQNLQIG